MKLKRFGALVIIIALLFTTSCGKAEPTVIGTVPNTKTIDISVAVCGDVMAHMPQIRAAQQSDGSYDFNSVFDEVREIMSSADLCMANFECTFPGEGEYMGYPAFRTPDSLAEAASNAGVDVGIFANNHMNDSGLAKALRTVEVIRENGMMVAGCRTSEDERRSVIYEINKGGETVKVGIVAYTYETSRDDTSRSMNGGFMRQEAVNYYNTFRQYADKTYLNQDIVNICNEIAYCKDNADITLVYLHWGEEYQRHSGKTQQYIAEKLSLAQPDAIVASHPHVIQEIDTVNGVPVYYSIGNYVSNQREETLNNHYTEQGLIAMLDFTLVKSPVDDGKYVLQGSSILGTPEEVAAEEAYNKKLIKLFTKAPEKAPVVWTSYSNWSLENKEIKACPTWVNCHYYNGKNTYVIVPLIGDLNDSPSLVRAGRVQRASSALEDIRELIGDQYIWNSK